MPHRDRHLPIAPLQALHARDRRAFEIVLQGRRNRVGLFGRQEAELELLLVVDEVVGLRHRTCGDLKFHIKKFTIVGRDVIIVCEIFYLPFAQPPRNVLHSPPVEHVLFIKSSAFAAIRQRVAGFMDYAAAKSWNVQIVEPIGSRRELKRLIDFWKPAGSIVCCGAGNNDFPSSAFPSPVVYLDRPANALGKGDSYVCHDSVATARMAARELLSLGFSYYAYVGARKPLDWDVARRRAFAETIAMHGHEQFFFDADSCADDERSFVSHLADWLGELPRPIGILATNDIIAEKVISACRRSGIPVPKDCAVIGIDDEDVCEYTKPTLTSVEPDYREAGRTAAAVLDRLMGGHDSGPIRSLYQPVRIVRRESTRRLAHHDRDVAAVLERIRKNACNGFSALDAVVTFKCSRRMAEMRFRRAVGHSILEEIRAVRLERAEDLLQNSDAKLDAIANWCGYKSAAAFSIFYKTETGRTPRQKR